MDAGNLTLGLESFVALGPVADAYWQNSERSVGLKRPSGDRPAGGRVSASEQKQNFAERFSDGDGYSEVRGRGGA